ncbi:hypothetical protein [Qipengyuania vesicularis]|uniref:hypothetical protein n=1 Tax=Qipengyuania vesicularis TaxID=2867232 RepID=UPI001C885DCC|nr:hypothetical protein [Qipengyuania vesicularis]MBX7527021.1 hypothetical protein [Qipengyuania vesicularis]
MHNRNFLTLIPACSLVLVPSGAVAKEEDRIALEPSGAWNADFGDLHCRLNRTMIGKDADAVFSLTLEPIPTHAKMHISLRAEDEIKPKAGRADVLIDGSAGEGSHYSKRGYANDFQIWEFSVDLSRADIGATQSSISLRTDYGDNFELSLDGFSEAWAVMETCLADLHSFLEIDTDSLDRMAVAPKGEIHEFVDLPRKYTETSFSILYTVSSDGKIASCDLMKASGDEKIYGKICQDFIAKGKLEPARDADGKPLAVPQFRSLSVMQMEFSEVTRF